MTLPVFAVYLVTLNPSLFRNDSPETITACWNLGVSHPPGYPLFTLLGRVFTLIPLGNPAMTLNLFAALCGALGAWFFFELARKVLEGVDPSKGAAARMAALTAAYALAFSKSYWSASLAAKGGIYAFQAALELATLLLVLGLMDKKIKKGTIAGRYGSLAFALGLGLVNQWPTQFLLLAALAVVLFSLPRSRQRPRSAITPKTFLTLGAFLLLVLSLYLYVPIRAHSGPLLNFGNPSDWSHFMGSLLRTRYFKTETMASAPESFWPTLSQKSLYISDRFSWEFPALFSCFVLWGAWALRGRNLLPHLLLSLMLVLITIVASLLYLQVGPIDFWHLDDHLLTLNWITGLLGAVGLYSLLVLLQDRTKWSWIAPTLAILLPFFSIHKSLPSTDQTREFLYRGIGVQAMRSMDRRPTYFAESDFDYFSLVYLKAVEGKRPDMKIFLCTFLEEKDWDYMAHDWFPKTSPQDPPLYCAFANGDLVNGLLKRTSSVSLYPTGTVIRFLPGRSQRAGIPDRAPLDDLWDRYLFPALKGEGSFEPSLNPINGLMAELCAHPYLNMSKYLLLHGDRSHWDVDQGRALCLVQDPHWRGEIWEDKARTDLGLGRRPESIFELQKAAEAFELAGDFAGSRTANQLATQLSNQP